MSEGFVSVSKQDFFWPSVCREEQTVTRVLLSSLADDTARDVL